MSDDDETGPGGCPGGDDQGLHHVVAIRATEITEDELPFVVQLSRNQPDPAPGDTPRLPHRDVRGTPESVDAVVRDPSLVMVTSPPEAYIVTQIPSSCTCGTNLQQFAEQFRRNIKPFLAQGPHSLVGLANVHYLRSHKLGICCMKAFAAPIHNVFCKNDRDVVRVHASTVLAARHPVPGTESVAVFSRFNPEAMRPPIPLAPTPDEIAAAYEAEDAAAAEDAGAAAAAAPAPKIRKKEAAAAGAGAAAPADEP
jgi:hypothetical protein